jgi:SAM-dependent methyltransferase
MPDPERGGHPVRVTLPIDRLLPRLRCPGCEGVLTRGKIELHCPHCSRSYEDTVSGQLDLRPAIPRSITLPLVLGGEVGTPGDEWPPLSAKAEPEVDFSGADVPFHLSHELLTWFPRASGPEALALDLGCGTAPHRGVCERAGFTHVGVDYEGDAALVLADAHCLPFEKHSFDFVLSIAVLEHVRHPLVFMREVARVLRPGGTFIGTVAFLEPFHARSYYHHTHLGLLNCLNHAPLECVAFGPVSSWPALRALGEMALFPPLPPPLTRILVSPLQALHRLWWGVAGLVRPRATDARRRTWTAGAFEFVARKSGVSEDADSTR